MPKKCGTGIAEMSRSCHCHAERPGVIGPGGWLRQRRGGRSEGEERGRERRRVWWSVPSDLRPG